MDRETARQISIRQIIEPMVKARGLELFDIEVPSGRSGFLKVFINRPGSSDKGAGKGPTADISDCAQLSKDILNHPQVEEILPGECQLEVSSPGINRKLTRGEHFEGAIGERVRLVVVEDTKKKEIFRGKLLAFNGKQIEIADEERKSNQIVEYHSVSEARVDFNFNA